MCATGALVSGLFEYGCRVFVLYLNFKKVANVKQSLFELTL